MQCERAGMRYAHFTVWSLVKLRCRQLVCTLHRCFTTRATLLSSPFFSLYMPRIHARMSHIHTHKRLRASIADAYPFHSFIRRNLFGILLLFAKTCNAAATAVDHASPAYSTHIVNEVIRFHVLLHILFFFYSLISTHK